MTNDPETRDNGGEQAAGERAGRALVRTGERREGRDRDDRGDRGGRDDDGGGRRFSARRRGCEFCVNKISVLDYKDVGRLRHYVGDRGKLEPRRKVGTCAKHQRWVRNAVKRARFMALLPYTAEHIRVTGVQAGSSRRY
ncbi:MAG: 30S ribosomal protein S18 [Dehalococcoidia bacterium]|nr:30S ribosomal protein S18 [Dehalococcoidia bacterium]